jgi:MFS family permease
MGTLSDRIGKRKPFIYIGYILWGLFTILFGLTEFINNLGVVAIVSVISADAIMSFFGSVGNDSGFNAWTTDIMNDQNRGQIGATLAAHPVIATIVGTVVGGIIIEAFGYLTFFTIMGLLVMIIGIYSFFTLQDAKDLTPKINEKSFWKQLFSVFNFKNVYKNKELFYAFITMSVFFIGFNVYFIHIGNFFVYTLNIDIGLAGVIQGGCLLLAIFATIPAAKIINQGKSVFLIRLALIIDVLGLIILYFFSKSNMIILVIGVILAGIGYVLVTQTLTVWAKKLYPIESRGQFEGVRIVFFVMIPMIMGPLIADPFIKNFGLPIVNDQGIEGMAPTEILFMVSTLIALLTFIPVYFASKHQKSLLK